jgi:hypothetical protein
MGTPTNFHDERLGSGQFQPVPLPILREGVWGLEYEDSNLIVDGGASQSCQRRLGKHRKYLRIASSLPQTVDPRRANGDKSIRQTESRNGILAPCAPSSAWGPTVSPAWVYRSIMACKLQSIPAVRYAATAGPHRVRRNALSRMVGAAKIWAPRPMPTKQHPLRVARAPAHLAGVIRWHRRQGRVDGEVNVGVVAGGAVLQVFLEQRPVRTLQDHPPVGPHLVHLVWPPRHQDVGADGGLSSEVHQVPHQELPFPRPVARLPHVLVPPLISLLRRQQVS